MLKSCYLAGPMRGHRRYNFDAFLAAELSLINQGWDLKSPARHDLNMGFNPDGSIDDQPGMAGGRFDMQKAFLWDLKQVARTDIIVLLPGWENSSGARTERIVAEFLGKPVFLYENGLLTADVPLVETVCEEAGRIVDGDRMATYGHPLDDFGATSEYWATWIRHKYGIAVPLEAEDVGWMMSLLKHSREGNIPKRDNKVDVIGYIRTVEKCEEERARRSQGSVVNECNTTAADPDMLDQWRCEND